MKFCKIKYSKNSHGGNEYYKVVLVEKKYGDVYRYKSWKQTKDGFVFTFTKFGRKDYETVEQAFKAAKIGKKNPYYLGEVGVGKKIFSPEETNDLYKYLYEYEKHYPITSCEYFI